MRSLGEGLGIDRTVTLTSAPAQSGIPMTLSTSIAMNRVAPEELETVYGHDGLTFNEVNKFVQTIMAAGYKIEGNDSKTRDYIIDLLDSIGNVGESTTWDELLTEDYRDAAIYGNTWTELVPNKSGDEIVDLKRIDPKLMDIARTGTQNQAALDKFGRPLGFTMKIPYGMSIKQKDKVPEGVSLAFGQKLFLKPERIAQFKLYTFGDGFIGIGLIEPAYKSVVRKLNIEEAHSNYLYNTGFAPRLGYVGDINHEPTPQQVENMLNQLKDLNYKQNLAMAYYNKVELLEPKKTDTLQSNVQFLQSQQVAASGMPQALVTGSGEETNRQTLTNQQIFFEYGLKDITTRFCSAIRKQIFERAIRLKFGENQDIPRIVWNKISTAEHNDKAERITNYVREGMISPMDPALKKYIEESENLKLMEGLPEPAVPTPVSIKKEITKENPEIPKVK